MDVYSILNTAEENDTKFTCMFYILTKNILFYKH